MKKHIKVLNFCIPTLIYIACSLLAFLLWKVFNFVAAPIIITSVILCIIGSLASGFFTKDKYGKRGKYLTIAIVVAALVLWIISNAFMIDATAYVATVFSSYLYNIQTILSFGTPDYILYIGYAVSLIVPIALILLGRFIRVKVYKNKA